jgi:uncharacterized membrane protein ArfB
MNFVIEWLWYLVAFVLGSAAALLIAIVAIRPTNVEQALDELPGSREIGAH